MFAGMENFSLTGDEQPFRPTQKASDFVNAKKL